ncbi:MAG: CPBP family glutamic-type intramembrane protease [Planctomycetaceae bacterium]|nr:CPBP family intramembrane metalloprotease [Planctomycetaceae bacterium]
MTASDKNIRPDELGYFAQSRQAWNILMFITLPLLGFHMVAAWHPSGLVVPYYFNFVFQHLGASAVHLSSLLIVSTLLVAHWRTRAPWRLEPAVLIGMAVESILWTLPLVALSFLLGFMAAQTSQAATSAATALHLVTQAVGAGIYEEFFFRLVLISVALAIFVDLFEMPQRPVLMVAVTVSAIVFALCHWGGLATPEGFAWQRFFFLLLAGLLWGTIYVHRGLGIAIGSHIVWDLYAMAF